MGRDQRLNPAAARFAATSGGGLRSQVVRDAAGRVLQPGDLIVLRTVNEQFWEVAEVKPDLRPGVPANVMLIKLVAVAAFNAPADLPQMEFVRVITAEEKQTARAEAQAEAQAVAEKHLDLQIVRPGEHEQAEADEAPSGEEGVPV